jgi:hypothetical protein
VYVHVISDRPRGKVTASQITRQIAVLNAGYEGTGLTFRLAGSETTVNSSGTTWSKAAPRSGR